MEFRGLYRPLKAGKYILVDKLLRQVVPLLNICENFETATKIFPVRQIALIENLVWIRAYSLRDK